MKIALIWAMAQNRTIGINNKLPWHLPNDLKYFKEVTMAKPIIMGRKTFESIGKPLPGRTNIVVTRDTSWSKDGVTVVHSLDDAFAQAEALIEVNGFEEVMVIGGAEIYKQALPKADRLYLTLVHHEVRGDAFAPEVDFSDWQQIGREDFPAKDPNPYNYSFVVYDRVEAPVLH